MLIPAEILKKVKIVPVQMIEEVLKLALEKYPLPAPKEPAKQSAAQASKMRKGSTAEART